MPITIRRKDELLAKLSRLAPAAKAALTEANAKTADEMVRLARSFVPVRTGRLRASIVATPPGGSPPAHSQGGVKQVPEGAYAVTAGNRRVRYAHLVEFGTRPHENAGERAGTHNPGAPAQPFFFPAYRLVRKAMKSKASRALNKSIKAVAAGK